MDSVWRSRIIRAVEELCENPFEKTNVKKLVNSPYYRLRVGNYRVIFDVQRGQLLILIIHVKKREDAYR